MRRARWGLRLNRRWAFCGAAILMAACAHHRVAPGPPLPLRTEFADQRGDTQARDDFFRVMLAHGREFRACVSPDEPSGKLILVWDILPNGDVENIGVRDPEYASLELSHCIARSVSTCHFAPSVAGIRAIHFPFKF